MNPVPPKQEGHLLPALLALALASLLLGGGYGYARVLEHRYIHALVDDFTETKLQGVVLQREAFRQPDLLALYGSSELVKKMPNNAAEFFADYPTGFRVFPVGKPGATSLTVLLRLAGVGEELRGRKVAISLSPGWFFTEKFDPRYYEGNFSELQASELLFQSGLSRELRRDLARRLLDFPRTLEGRETLGFAARCAAGEGVWSAAGYALVWPLGRLQSALGRGQDHVEVVLHLLEQDEKLDSREARPQRSPRGRMAWANVLKRAAHYASGAALQRKRSEVARKHLARASRDRTFLQTMHEAREWVDVELLLRLLKERGAEPLLLSMPVEDIRLEVYGVSPEARTAYLSRISELAYTYGFPLLDFHEYEKDPTFLVDFLDHLSGTGWLYYNKALDDFFHGRVSAP